eukprot:2768036-Pleurochrysis_carterae.AAC.3
MAATSGAERQRETKRLCSRRGWLASSFSSRLSRAERISGRRWARSPPKHASSCTSTTRCAALRPSQRRYFSARLPHAAHFGARRLLQRPPYMQFSQALGTCDVHHCHFKGECAQPGAGAD